jgi:hypothetical protein
VSQIDYKLSDFYKETHDKIRELVDLLGKIKLRKSEKEFWIWKQALDRAGNLLGVYKRTSYLVLNKMLVYEWISLLILYAIILSSLIYLNNNSLFVVFLLAFVSTALALLLLILNDLNNLKWKEKNWIWIPLSQLFVDLDLKPYFPGGVFRKKRVNVKDFREFKEIRVAYYPNKYPNMVGKRVRVIKVG